MSIHKSMFTQAIMFTSAQLRAARAMLDWSRATLAKKSGTSADTVVSFESRGSDPKLSTLLKWRRALGAGGVQFIDEDASGGPGVRLHARKGGKRK